MESDPRYLDPSQLAKDYEPLIKAVYKRFNTYFNNYDDKMDLYGQVYLEFSKLVSEFDPRRGVDFPCYIKRMLSQRVYHYITKQLKVLNNESVSDNLLEDISTTQAVIDENLELVEGLASIDESLSLGKKQKKLLVGVLHDRKSLEELAEEEGVDVKTIRLRLHFLCKKLVEHNQEMEDYCKFQKEPIM